MPQRHRHSLLFVTAILPIVGAATGAAAHGLDHAVGVGAGTGTAAGFLGGLLHPLTGLDHLLGMLAVGMWSVHHGERVARWMPAVFAVVMAHGAIMAATGQSLPAAQFGVAASVATIGVLLAAAMTLRLPIAFFVTAIFAMFLGFSHGAEIAEQAEQTGSAAASAFAAGLLAVTVALQLLGVWAGKRMRERQMPILARAVGAGCVLAGAVALIAH